MLSVVAPPVITTPDMSTLSGTVILCVSSASIAFGNSPVASGSVVSALSVRVTLAKCCPERSPPAVTETTDVVASSSVIPPVAWLKPVACV